MQKFGIDISRWQGEFNLKQAMTEGVEFAILKIGGGDDGIYLDRKFEDYYTSSRCLGLPVGCYFFGQAMTKEKAIEEANAWVNMMKGHKFEYPVFYDVEAKMLQLPSDVLTDIILTVCGIVERAGYWVGVYSSIDFFNYNMQDEKLVNYSHWVASWGVNKPTLAKGGDTQMWQFGGEKNLLRSNKICGQVVDQNFCYIDYPTLIKSAGLNNYSTEEVTNNLDIIEYLEAWEDKYDGLAKEVCHVVIDRLIEDIRKEL